MSARETWNIMLVDDSEDDRAHLKSLLRQDEERRYRFFEASSGEMGVAELQKEDMPPPDAMILDYHLHDMNATEFLEKIKGGQEFTPCPVVILTGSASNATARAALQAGAQDYVGKHWMTTQSLSRVIENACERWRMTKSIIQHRSDLQTSERFCRAIMESSPDSIKALDKDGIIKRVNAAAIRRWGVTSEEDLIGKRWSDIWPENNRKLAEEAVRRASEGETFRFRSQSYAAEGLERWWDSIVSPLRDCSSEEITGLLATSRDVTEQKRAEDAAYAAQAMAEAASKGKDHFLATLSHELRNPLNPVSLIAGEMLKDPSLDESSLKAWQLVQRNVAIQATLIDDLLDLSRITQGKMELHYLEIDAHQILRDAVETTRSAFEAKQITLKLSLDAKSAHVWGDLVRLQQVLWNLLSNAAKFTPGGGTVTLTSSNPGAESLEISVRDTGIGMSADELERVFRPFEQGDHSNDVIRSRGGLGLGLAITRQLLEMHAGSVRAESTGKGHGSAFTVSIPLTSSGLRPEASFVSQLRLAKSHETEGRAKSTTPTKPLKLLVVDDDASSRDTLARLLERRGHNVFTAGSLEEAREVASRESFEVLLADLGLPDGSGHELMIELRRDASRTTPLYGIAISGYGMAEDIAASRQAGFSAHIVKPISLDILDAELKRLGAVIPEE